MNIIVQINTCKDCRHLNHSGAFTARGARPICGHDNACEIRVSMNKFRKEYPEYSESTLSDGWKYHWIHRCLTKNSADTITNIPEWCPLKHGFKY